MTPRERHAQTLRVATHLAKAVEHVDLDDHHLRWPRYALITMICHATATQKLQPRQFDQPDGQAAFEAVALLLTEQNLIRNRLDFTDLPNTWHKIASLAYGPIYKRRSQQRSTK